MIGILMIPIGAAAVFDVGHQTLLYKACRAFFSSIMDRFRFVGM